MVYNGKYKVYKGWGKAAEWYNVGARGAYRGVNNG